MAEVTVRDLMVHGDAYATVSASDTLRDVVLALDKARALERRQHPEHDPDRAVLVIWQADIIGKITMLDIISSLGPRRDSHTREASSLGPLMESMTREFALRQTSLSRLVEKACKLTVRDLLRPYAKDETIAIDAPLDMALHQFISGEYRSLLVTSDRAIVGILRLVEVYKYISKKIIDYGPSP